MAEKAKFDREAAFKSIIGASRKPEAESVELQSAAKGKNKNRVQRSYFLDRDVEKALRRKAMDEERNLTETINMLLRDSLGEYLQSD